MTCWGLEGQRTRLGQKGHLQGDCDYRLSPQGGWPLGDVQTEAGQGWRGAGSRWERQVQCRPGVQPPGHWPEAKQSQIRGTSTSTQPNRSQISWGFRPGTHRRGQGPGQLCTFGAKQDAAKEESSGAVGMGEMLPAGTPGGHDF